MSEAEGPGRPGLGSGDPRREPKGRASGSPPIVPALHRAPTPLGSAWSHELRTTPQLTQLWHLTDEGTEAP